MRLMDKPFTKEEKYDALRMLDGCIARICTSDNLIEIIRMVGFANDYISMLAQSNMLKIEAEKGTQGMKPFTVLADKWDEFLRHKTDEETLARCKRIDALIPDSAKVQEFNRHEVACIIADAIGDDCACNVNGNNEWLPMYCDFSETVCPNPVGVACWEQYLKHLDKKQKGAQE